MLFLLIILSFQFHCWFYVSNLIDIEGIIVLHFVLTNDGSWYYNWINVYLELLYKLILANSQ